jgi:carbon monoxide dehydrogenase subunit G
VQLEHSFSVPVTVDEAWQILLDIERVGACMPGAMIDSVDGDNFTGTVKVKLGPINLTYKGHASFVEKDEAERRAVIDARGKDARGNGTAEARVTATLHDAGDSTDVKVNTELDITGKPAQFGRGVMVDVGNKLLGQFADELARTIRGGAAPSATAARTGPAHAADEPAAQPAAEPPLTPDPAAAPAPAAAAEPVGTVNGHPSAYVAEPQQDVEPIDLIKHAGPAVAKRLAPLALAVVIVLIAIRRRRRS